MPIRMPENTGIVIQKRELPADYKMPQMERAEKHYTLGYIISGDRRVITPYEKYDAHAGDITAMPPMLYHRTFSGSGKAYVNYLIKASQRIKDSFCSEVDAQIWRYIFEQKRFSFKDEARSKIEGILADMLDIYTKGEDYSEVLLKGLFFRLLVLIRDENIAGGNDLFKNKLSKNIIEAMYYIEQNHAENIRLADAAASAGFSEGHFSRLFKTETGTAFSQYLINVRLRHAKEMLINTELPVSEIALQTGFGSGDYLSACFHKYEGISPREFRASKGGGT